MTTQDASVPRYFSDFVQENARQHQELSDRIGSVHQELSDRIGSGHQELADRIGSVHQELSAAIHEVKGELHILKVVGIAMLVALLGILGTGVTGLVTYFLNL